MNTALFFCRTVGLIIAAGLPCFLAVGFAAAGDFGVPFWLFALASASVSHALAKDLRANLSKDRP